MRSPDPRNSLAPSEAPDGRLVLRAWATGTQTQEPGPRLGVEFLDRFPDLPMLPLVYPVNEAATDQSLPR